MKNISRRVFIKGLAVAGVAAAASTVLAGCNTNMIPGVDDGKDDTETPEAPVTTITFADPNNSSKTVSIVSKSFALGSTLVGTENDATITFLVDNKLGQNVGVVADDLTATSTTAKELGVGADNYYVLVSAYADGNKFKTVTLGGDLIATNTTSASDVIADTKAETRKLTFNVEDDSVEKSVTVKMAFMKIDNITGGKVYVSEVESKEFTYNL